jgi:tetratricopeptide (TPR) repeat protein
VHTYSAAVLDTLGRREQARDSLRLARSLLAETLRAHPEDVEVRFELASLLHNTGIFDTTTAPFEETRALFDEARVLIEQLLRSHSNNPSVLELRANIYNHTGGLLARHGKTAEALKQFQEAVLLRERLLERSPNKPRLSWGLGEALCNAGAALFEMDRLSESMKMYVRATPLLEALNRTSSQVLPYRVQLGLCYIGTGQVQHKQGDFRGALKSFERARDVLQQIVRERPTVLDFQYRLERALLGVGDAYSHLGDPKKTQHAYEKARDIQAVLAKKHSSDPDRASRLAVTQHNVGVMLVLQGRLEDARAALLAAARQQRRALSLSPGTQGYRRLLSATFGLLAQIERGLYRPDRARDVCRERLALWEGNGGELYSVAREFAITATVARELKLREQCVELALDALRRAVQAGFRDARRARTDPALRMLRDRDEFRQLWTDRTRDSLSR